MMTFKEAERMLETMRLRQSALRKDADRLWEHGNKAGSTALHDEASALGVKITTLENAFVMVPV